MEVIKEFLLNDALLYKHSFNFIKTFFYIKAFVSGLIHPEQL